MSRKRTPPTDLDLTEFELPDEVIDGLVEDWLVPLLTDELLICDQTAELKKNRSQNG